MRINLVSDRPPLTSLLRIFLLVLLVGWIFTGQALGIAAGSFVYEGDFMRDMLDPTDHPNLRGALLLTQGIGSAIGLIVIPWMYLRFTERRDFGRFFKREERMPLVMVSLLIAVISLAAALSPIAEWNANMQFPQWMGGFGTWARDTEAAAETLIKAITQNLTPVDFFFTFIVVAILPGIGEELVFRGMIQTELQRAFGSPHIAVWTAAVLFSAIHMQFLGFVPRLLIGAFLGYLYFWSNNLWVPIFAHFLNNGVQLTGLYLYQNGMLTFDVESTESAPWWIVIATAVLTLALLFYLKNYFESRPESSHGPA